MYLVIRATERGWSPIRSTLWRPRTLELVGQSVLLATVVTLACVAIGVGAAWLVARTDIAGGHLWRVVLGLPLAMPSYVSAWAWLALGPELDGFGGALLVLTSVSFPYVYLPVLAALRRSDPALEEVARSLGRGPVRVFLTVTVRQVRIAATGGALLVGLYALSDFGAVSIMRYDSLTHVIYTSYRASFDRTPAAVLGLVLAALAVVLVIVDARVRGDSRDAKIGSGAVRAAPPVRLGRWQWPACLALLAVVVTSIGVPLWSLTTWLQRGRSRADWGEVVDAAGSTLWIAALAAAVTIALAIPVGVLAARHAGRLSRAAAASAYAGHSLPGIVVALSLVFFGIRFATSLYQTAAMLVFAYVVLFLSLGIGAVHGSVAQSPPVLEEVARSLGRTQWGAWRSITIRLAAPGIGAGAALVFLTVMKELPATLLLRPIGMDTLATRLWSHTANASFAAGAPYAAMIIVLAAIPTALLTRHR